MAKLFGSLLVCICLGYASLSFAQVNGSDQPASSNDRPIQQAVFSDLRPPYLATAAGTSTNVTGSGPDALAMFAPEPIAPSNGSISPKMQRPIPEPPTPRFFDRQFKMLTALSIAATTADIESTLHCSQSCREVNPLYGAHPTRARLYGINAPFLVGELMISRMVRKRLPGRKLWMVPSLSLSASHMFGVASNLRAR